MSQWPTHKRRRRSSARKRQRRGAAHSKPEPGQNWNDQRVLASRVRELVRSGKASRLVLGPTSAKQGDERALRDSVRVRTDRRPTADSLRRLPVQPRKARRHQVACAAPASPSRGTDVRCRQLRDAVDSGGSRRAVSPRRSGARPGQPAGALPSSQRQQRRKDRLHAAAAVRVWRSVLPGSVAPVNPSERNPSTAITRLDTEGDARVVAQEGHFLGGYFEDP